MFIRKPLVVLIVLFALLETVAAADWETDYAKALQLAKTQNKRVLLDFTGSDWCPPCIALRKRVFSNAEFAAYAQKNLILVELDFPRKKEQSEQLKSQNEKLSTQYGVDEK